MTIPAEYQQAHTTLGCEEIAGTWSARPTECWMHRENVWTLNGCPVAVRAAREIGADALDRAADDLNARVNDSTLIALADKYGGYYSGQRASRQAEEIRLRARAERLRTGEDDD